MYAPIQQALPMPERASPEVEELLDAMYAAYEAERAAVLATFVVVPRHAACDFCLDVHLTTIEWAR